MATATLQSEWRPAASRGVRSTAPIWFAATAFFLVHFLLRCLLTSELHRDDAELLYFDQALAWGYSEQAPLLSWAFRAWGLLFGVSHFSLALMRTAMLAGAFLGIYANARILGLGEHTSVYAACSMLLLPLTAWHAIHHWTHSLLLVGVMLATLLVFLRWLHRPSWRATVALGVLGGLGMLAKYNFAVFAVALPAAAISIRGFREFSWRRLSLAIAIGSLVFLPHGIWLLQHWNDVWTGYVDKFSPGERTAVPIPAGVVGLGKNAAVLLGIPCLLTLWIAGGKSILTRKLANRQVDLLARYLVFALVVFSVITLLVGFNRFQQRWLEPFVVPIVLLLFLRLGENGLQKFQRRRLAAALLFLGIGLTACRAGQVWMSRTADESGLDYRTLAGHLGETGIATAVITHDGSIAGNLRFHASQIPVVNIDRPALPIASADRKRIYVLVWDVSVHGENTPEFLIDAATRLGGAPMRIASPIRQMRITHRLAGEPPLQVAWQAFARADS